MDGSRHGGGDGRGAHATPGCGALAESGHLCTATVDAESGLGLCSAHLVAAYDWVARDVGVTDLLDSPCLACGSRLGVRFSSGWLCAICEWRVGEIPSGDIRTTRVDVVYYLRFGDRIKIGTSGNPRARLAQLKWDELLAFEPGDRAVEHRRHLQFSEHRFAGSEWFHSNPALTAHITAISRGVDDPWSRYQRWLSEAIALRN